MLYVWQTVDLTDGILYPVPHFNTVILQVVEILTKAPRRTCYELPGYCTHLALTPQG